LHFGLGAVSIADLEIHWPSGQIEKLNAVPTGRLVTVREGSGIISSKELTADRHPENKELITR
jgi:hypothetical protein